MKKLNLIYVSAIVCFFAACTKEPSAAGGGASNRIIPKQPPLGYSFPATFSLSNTSTEFKAWVGNKEVSSSTNASLFFGADADEIKSLPTKIGIKLLNASNLEVTNSDYPNQPERAMYYFYNDTLWVVIPGTRNDTFPFFSGNYNQLQLNQHCYLITGKGRTRISGTNEGAMTTDGIYQKALDWSINPIDSIGYYNVKSTFKK